MNVWLYRALLILGCMLMLGVLLVFNLWQCVRLFAFEAWQLWRDFKTSWKEE